MRRAALLLATALLAACAGPQQRSTGPDPIDDPATALARAEAQLARGRTVAAEESLAYIDASRLDGEQRLRLRLLRAELSLRSAQPLLALRDLPAVNTTANRQLAAQVESLRAQALQQMGDVAGAVSALSTRRRLLDDRRQQQDNDQRLWQLLLAAPAGALDRGTVGNDRLAIGWLELARIARGEVGGQRDRLLRDWRSRFPDHPGDASLVEGALAARGFGGWSRPAPGSTIAVLLPRSGPLAPLASAVEAGLLAAHARLASPRPALRFYDSGGLPEQLPFLIDRAVADGAGLIIGPLQRSHVEVLATRGAPKVPVMVLNYLDAQLIAPHNLLQFGLAPEDEVRAAVATARAQGQTGMVALVQQADWSQRVVRELRDAAREQDARLLATRFIDAGGSIDDPVRDLLGIDEARARHDALIRIIGSSAEFEPKPRADIDAVLVVARQREALQAVPHLHFHGATELPIYTTALAWDGELPVPREIHAVRLCDMPWMRAATAAPWQAEREALREQLGELFERFPRLVALGHDAMQLGRALQQGAQPGDVLEEGATGRLALGADGRVRRQLQCAPLTADGPALPLTSPPPRPGARPVRHFGDAASTLSGRRDR